MESKIREQERAILAGLSAENMPAEERASEESLDELEALLDTAGGICCGKVLQQRPSPDPHFFLGEGKVEELKQLAQAQECTLVVFDNELSPSQQRALSKELDTKVLDRNGLILDIFAQRAATREGRLQVELAQYQYLLPRLTGMWTHLVRQTASGGSGPIGTRGPGETQLETDRRHIREKIDHLRGELEGVSRIRATQRRAREKSGTPVVAIVGYTNAGKSTLLNLLTNAGIPANNRLFDTLDTTTRRVRLSKTCEILLTDTVGFIRKLPHQLVEAFHATLEEVCYADVLLLMCDVSDPEWVSQARVARKLIEELGAGSTPCIEVYNKCDVCTCELPEGVKNSVRISARTGEGVDKLLALIEKTLEEGKRRVTLLVPYERGDVVELLHRKAQILSTDYAAEGTKLSAIVDGELYGRVKEFLFSDEG